MRLYGKITSERASKSQGGQEFLYVVFLDDEQVVARVDFSVDVRNNGQKLHYLEVADKTGIRSIPITPLGGERGNKKRVKCDVCGGDDAIIENIHGQITCEACETKRTINETKGKNEKGEVDFGTDDETNNPAHPAFGID